MLKSSMLDSFAARKHEMTNKREHPSLRLSVFVPYLTNQRERQGRSFRQILLSLGQSSEGGAGEVGSGEPGLPDRVVEGRGKCGNYG
jgi:hypothetical protein